MFVALLPAVAGCGGVSASKSVSPLDFFMPGLLQADPPTNSVPALAVETSQLLATVR